MTKEQVLENLRELIGNEYDEDEIICAFEDFEQDGETEVIVNTSCGNGYDAIAYINSANSTEFLFNLDKNKCITDVRIAQN